MKNHKSHHIFLYLGLLVLLFVGVFSVHYFQGTYKFTEVIATNNTGSYDEGIDIINPFEATPLVSQAHAATWQSFKKDNLMFAFPKEYQLRMNNKGSVFITAPYDASGDCESITDEQAQAFCYKPQISPNITITVHSDAFENPFANESSPVLINKEQWYRSTFQGEYGGTVSFSKSYTNETIQVAYDYADSNGGYSFDFLQDRLGNQYQLSQKKQEQLVRDIISTIEVE